MAVYDRWHTRKPRLDDAGKPVGQCREHKLYPSVEHGKGDRWQVRWRDEDDKQCSANRPKKSGKDPEISAEALDAKIRRELDTGTYVAPDAGRIKLKDYGKAWLADQPFDNPSTREATELRLRLHVFDDLIGGKELRALQPSTIRAWVKRKNANLSPTYVRTIYANLSALLNAAVDDNRIPKSPMKAESVRPPTLDRQRVVPWTVQQAAAVRAALPERYQAMVDDGVGLGLRQGEVFGQAVEDVDFLGRVVHVRRQVKIVQSRLVFAPPKGGKERDIPLPESVGLRLSAHIAAFPPVAVTLPWKKPDGKPVTVRLLFTSRERRAMNRNYFNTFLWKPALVAVGLPAIRENGFHALRHHFASVVLADGLDIRALADYLGHSDPGFTLRIYTHLMPQAGDRMRKAIDRALSGGADGLPGGTCARDVP